MSTITIRSGNVNLQNSSAILGVYLATRDDQNEGKGLTLREALAHSDDVQRAGSAQYAPAINHKPKEVCGSICTQTLELREGAIIRCLVMIRPEWGGTNVTCNIFIMARADAPLRKLSIRIGDNEHLVHNTFQVAGRYEILTGEEAQIQGAFVDDRFLRLASRNMQELVIDSLEELEPEIAKRKRQRKRRVTSDTGEKVVIKETRRRRGINL
jgi:hypothetical protein